MESAQTATSADEVLKRRDFLGSLFFGIFALAGLVALLNEVFLGIVYGWAQAHVFSHYLFGLGVPMVFASMSAFPARPAKKEWLIKLQRRFDVHAWKSFWVGVVFTEVWSTWNELVIYMLKNPAHGLDWHHWLADLTGIVTAVLVYHWLMQAALTRKS